MRKKNYKIKDLSYPPKEKENKNIFVSIQTFNSIPFMDLTSPTVMELGSSK